jgi:hypothetical protein
MREKSPAKVAKSPRYTFGDLIPHTFGDLIPRFNKPVSLRRCIPHLAIELSAQLFAVSFTSGRTPCRF